MSKFIPLSVPSLKGNEWKYIKECIDTEWVSSAGKYVDLFEQKISEYTGAKYAIATVNGTSALHISLILAGVKENDEVIVPTLTFIAPINAVKYVGAFPVFMDADKYYNIDVEKTIDFIQKETIFRDGFTYNKTTGRKISAIIPVHVFGNAVWLDELVPLYKERNIKIIEDATESLGTYYKVGNFSGKFTGTIGDLGTLSFNGNKIITTGGGGMILTDNEEYAQKARYLTTQAKDDELRYIHNEIGYNYRLTNIQAALGVAQLEQLEKFIEIKKENYLTFKKEINKINGLGISDVPQYARNNHWLNVLRVNENEYGKSKDKLLEYLNNNGIQTRPIWYLNHLQKPYKNEYSYKIENAYKLWEKSLNIPSSVTLNKKEKQRITELIRKNLR